jgi:AGCS family alanine or glycine:cation symporter
MEYIESILTQISDIIWGPPLIILLFGTHLFLTFRLKFIQRFIGKAIKISFKRSSEGTGNIVGVSTAIAYGGPGAVLWMWLTGVFGISTKYAEALLSVKYRTIGKDGTISGGPMYVLERGMNSKWLAVIFAGFTAITAFGIGNMVQSNSVATMVYETFQVSPWITGLILSGFTALVIIGGIKSISKVCERLIPFMAIFYVLGCIVLLIINYSTVPQSVYLILTSAFEGHAVVGGFLGAGVKEAIRFGIARGLFSNESGLGSAPIVAAAAQTKNPVRQALVSSTGTFWDTVVVCAITGTVIVNSYDWTHGLSGAALTKEAFTDIPIFGPIILTVGLLTFVFSTILGWSYYGEKAAQYLFGDKIIKPYRYAWVLFVLIGAVLSLNIVWTFADITNALMAIPNLISLIFLNKVIIQETRKYLWEGDIEAEG